MTVSSKVSSIIYSCDGSTTVFDVPFRFLEDQDLQLSIQATDGTVTNLVLNSDYTVTGANSDNGGKVHLTHPAPAQSKLSILRVMDLLQETDYRENERFPAESHERALDKLTMEVQQLQEQSDRAVKVGVFSDADPSEIVYEIEELYDIKDSVITAANISSDIVTCSENIEAIQNAPNQATIAATSAQNAEGYASSAHIDAGVAENSAQLAQQWATKMDGQVESTEYSSKYYAGQSAASATAAQEALDTVNGLIATPIGTIFQSIYVDESLDIARRLNGQLISSTKFTGFRAWLNDVLAAFPSLFTTETNWQAEKTNSKLGQCGKFVIDDDAGTIRLPAVVNAQGLLGLSGIGNLVNESLPNITGYFGDNLLAKKAYDTNNTAENIGAYGVFRGASVANGAVAASTATSDTWFVNGKISLDASRSSSTYQDNAPVQQEAVQYPYYIQVATGIEETLPAIREYNINTPFFFGQSMYSDVAPDNASWLVSNGQYNARAVYPDHYDWLVAQMNNGVSGFVASTDTYTDYDFVINTTDQTFRLPLLNGEESWVGNTSQTLSTADIVKDSPFQWTSTKNGFVKFTCYKLNVTQVVIASINGQTLIHLGTATTTTTPRPGFWLKVRKGDTISISAETQTLSGVSITFIPAVGNGSLYYYVGDTVQDASLINAGAVLGQLSTKTNFVEAAAASMPSDRYIDLTLGAIGSTYTAPANGYFVVTATSTSASRAFVIFEKSHGICSGDHSYSAETGLRCFVPCQKGKSTTFVYGGVTITGLWFVYAEGENNV